MSGPSSKPTGWGGEPVVRPTIADIEDAAAFLAGRIVRTPLLAIHGDEQRRRIFLKPETLQPIGSFKIRGALNWSRQLTDEQRAPGLSTCSAGNTAQAVGYVARQHGVSARSMLPDSVPANKIAAIESYGVTPVCMPVDELMMYMLEEQWKDEPYCYLNPWANPAMIAGSATVGLEIFEDLPDVETVFVPVGGGGLASGVGSALKALRPSVRIVAVQTEASPALRAAFEAERPMWVESHPTICEGAAVPLIVDEMYPLLREVVDEVVTVSEDDALAAVGHIAIHNKLVVEGAGGIAVAAALAGPDRGTSVCILSGASISTERLLAALNLPGR